MVYISVFSTLITLVFTTVVLLRYRQRGGKHLLFWGVGLLFYGIGTFSEVLLSWFFNGWVLKAWYLSGAMLTAAWLGQGTVNLLARKGRTAAVLNWTLVAVSLLSAVLAFSAPLTAAAAGYVTSVPASIQYKEIMLRSGLVTFLTIILNLYGTLGLVGGAIYSAFLFWRKKVLFDRMIGNVLIAAGGLMPAMGGSFLKAGLPDWLYISEFIGVILMFWGYTRAIASKE